MAFEEGGADQAGVGEGLAAAHGGGQDAAGGARVEGAGRDGGGRQGQGAEVGRAQGGSGREVAGRSQDVDGRWWARAEGHEGGAGGGCGEQCRQGPPQAG
nr:hypothetical protein [Actinomadura terrae]